mmetsp:Transcript_9282/g.19592  ORF Transcript_9282/g.19592 Transcript_9282/m.19592 type:complete len:241 (+) Transcript_9282:1839-2561(+)
MTAAGDARLLVFCCNSARASCISGKEETLSFNWSIALLTSSRLSSDKEPPVGLPEAAGLRWQSAATRSTAWVRSDSATTSRCRALISCFDNPSSSPVTLPDNFTRSSVNFSKFDAPVSSGLVLLSTSASNLDSRSLTCCGTVSSCLSFSTCSAGPRWAATVTSWCDWSSSSCLDCSVASASTCGLSNSSCISFSSPLLSFGPIVTPTTASSVASSCSCIRCSRPCNSCSPLSEDCSTAAT